MAAYRRHQPHTTVCTDINDTPPNLLLKIPTKLPRSHALCIPYCMLTPFIIINRPCLFFSIAYLFRVCIFNDFFSLLLQ